MERRWAKLTQSGIMAGKLKGVMPAVTPSGMRYDMVSMSLVMDGSVSPSCSDVTPQACSTTSAKVRPACYPRLCSVHQKKCL